MLALSQGRPGAFDLCFLNINEMDGVSDQFLRPDPARYLIAYWFWELPELPSRLQPEVRRFDEIWVASSFVKGNLVPYTSAPIHVMPAVVEPEPPAPFSRVATSGSPSELARFSSTLTRAQALRARIPLALSTRSSWHSRALRIAIRVCLVMKTLNLSRWPEAQFDLERRISDVGGIVIDDELTAAEMSALTNASDVYVSLHRSEGFGLGMAEAMYFEVPVIATRYSGSEEFLNSTNSCGVGFRIRSINPSELRYNPSSEMLYRSGMQWADPKIEQAAQWMRTLYENPSMRHRIGAAGAETIHNRFNAMTAGVVMRSRLEEIARCGPEEVAPRGLDRSIAL